MRRARIKILANVPKRRKVLQSTTTTKPENEKNSSAPKDTNICKTYENYIPTKETDNSSSGIAVGNIILQDLEEELIENEKNNESSNKVDSTNLKLNNIMLNQFGIEIKNIICDTNHINGDNIDSYNEHKCVTNSLRETNCLPCDTIAVNNQLIGSNLNTSNQRIEEKNLSPLIECQTITVKCNQDSFTHKRNVNKLTLHDLIEVKNLPRKKKINSNTISTALAVVEVTNKNTMPAPQVKIGANGQLVLDQESIFIKQTNYLEDIDRSTILIEDEHSNRRAHFNKRRPKAWTNWETTKFFTALNAVGTDFTLMQNLFPDRTRAALKQKFKREERSNKVLVDKALSQQEYNIDSIEKQFALIEKEEKFEKYLRKSHISSKANKSENLKKKRRRKRCRIVVSSIESYGTDDDKSNDAVSIHNDEDRCDSLSNTKSVNEDSDMYVYKVRWNARNGRREIVNVSKQKTLSTSDCTKKTNRISVNTVK